MKYTLFCKNVEAEIVQTFKNVLRTFIKNIQFVIMSSSAASTPKIRRSWKKKKECSQLSVNVIVIDRSCWKSSLKPRAQPYPNLSTSREQPTVYARNYVQNTQEILTSSWLMTVSLTASSVLTSK